VDFDYFGNDFAVAISNNRIVVGAFGVNSFRGTAYVFGDASDPQSGRSYAQLFILTANDGGRGHRFGESVAIDGNNIVVGARFAPGETNLAGAVYVYEISDDSNGDIISISQVAKLTASGGKREDYFGASVAIRGKFILVGASKVEKGTIVNAGAAYLFAFLAKNSDPPQWTQLQQFQPNDLIDVASFGWSVAMDDNIAVIGTYDSAANSAYVFAPVDPSSSLSSAWTQITKLTGPTDSWFGSSVAVAGSWMVVGAERDDNIKGTNAGAVYIYSKTSSSSSPWSQITQLLAADGANSDYFGKSVAISKDASTIVVGAYWDDFSDSTTTTTDSGAAYLFRATISTTTAAVEWAQMGNFVAADRASNDQLGISIAIEDNIVVVGAVGDDTNQGSAYVLDTGFPPKASPSPSSVPSRIPSFTPSTKPSTKPSHTPSSLPSGSPSAIPSQSPSVTPSGVPSSMPSFRPSPAPIVNTASTPVKDTKPWNTIWSLIVSGFVVLGMIACLLL
jgi:hypothetical protein